MLSVIIPTLNEEKLIAGLLGRFTPALRERFGLELIVTDGGSTDRTLELCEGHVDQIVQHTGGERQTIGQGRNAGARVAQGEMLLFLNADVTLPSDLAGFLDALSAAVQEKGIATCRVQVHPDHATVADRLVLGTCDRIFWLFNRLGIGMGRGECHAVRRALFEQVGRYDERLIAGEDFDLYHRIAGLLRAEGERIPFLWEWTIYEDPRRYRELGYARTMWAWFTNTMSVTFRDRSYSEEWSVIR
ncbi:MAG: glycosyltransferase [Bacteroidota bacterium]